MVGGEAGRIISGGQLKTASKQKPILCVDFDGVLHSYTSSWRGARVIPDMPVKGALQFLAEATTYFQVMIFSSRSRYLGGRRAMKHWLWDRYAEIGGVKRRKWFLGPFEQIHDIPAIPHWYWRTILSDTGMDPWKYEVDLGIKKLLRKIRFPTRKPPAFVLIDDRCICFQGTFPTFEELVEFRPWRADRVFWK